MIIVPEIQTVVILVPRTGSGSLRRAIAAKYPGSVLLYRHMEAEGVPAGYDRWQKVGVLRDPVQRLWSLYKFCQRFREKFGEHSDQEQAHVDAIVQSVDMPFSEWIVNNQLPFTNPYDSSGRGRFWPQYTVRHSLPENRKSQFVYLRPDLGTKVYPYSGLGTLYQELGIADLFRTNSTPPSPAPQLSDEAKDHVRRFFAWDFAALRNNRILGRVA
ncbi:hypothetical protein [Mesorhizobium sp. B2-8-9]|uniref:hypothetical protein n=1 Tax=Mesorhizobium sp. B2-8-9 TaxID=2589899 RepID=UPI001128A12B|nr:hypothetical protein [Mesorhizobium sp. B2-8-9]TPI86398.1 hypothetical protein FJ423_00825 [Mesorhizobium sp. B2-8-9]